MLDATIILQILWTSLATSSYYVLFAVAFALVLKVTRLFNFAQAAIMTIAFYTVFVAVQWLEWPAWAAFGCSFLIAMGLVMWDAVHNDSPDTHPLQTDRLWLRLVGIFFMAVCFAIPVTVVFRSLRWTSR